MTHICPHCAQPISVLLFREPPAQPAPPEPEPRTEAVCWRAPNAHPPHPWDSADTEGNRIVYWCPGVKGTTMY